jgi:hypothetical protein
VGSINTLNIADPRPVVKADPTLITNGYEPVAVEGKAALGDRWSTRPNTVEAIAAERAALPNAVSTGLRTGTLVGIDVDILDLAHAEQMETLAVSVLGFTTLRRVGKKGCLLCYRTATPSTKITVATEDSAGVEILGKGQ